MKHPSAAVAFVLVLANVSFGQSTQASPQEGPPVEPASEVPS